LIKSVPVLVRDKALYNILLKSLSQARGYFINIWDQLFNDNRQFTEHDHHPSLKIFACRSSGELIAGLPGETFWRWLHISILWVHEHHRQKDLGQQIIAPAESEAMKRGCRHAHGDTLDFQAPEFYRQLGYTVWGVLDDLPPGHQRIFLRKDLVEK
jgi:GNAT superfamily N-acetyltransferase